MNEALKAADHSKVAVGAASALAEALGLTGIYHGIAEGYKAKHEKEYLQLYPQLLAMRAKRDQMLKFIPNFAQGLITKFLKELQDFEDFMKSLTEVKWDQYAKNVVTTVGANAMLDNGVLAASAYSAVGPFMGLIGAVSFASNPVIADTMASHSGWTEGGGTNAPTYTGPRKTIAWSAASAKSKSPSSAPVFAITGTGTAKGVFLVLHTSAVSTLDSTAGTLYSAGLFTGGDQAVVNTNTLTVTYAATA
jgi:Tfp pilus assembly protein PilV